MKNISRLVLVAVIAIIVGGTAFLSSWDIPAPVTAIEKVLPDDRFAR
jgi:hypothetical protein